MPLMLGIQLMAMAAEPLKAADLPKEVMFDVEYAREMCRSLGQNFTYDPRYIDTNDFNGDGQTDYILDGRGYYCGLHTDSLFGGRMGKPLYLYLSQPDGEWKKSFSAYVYEYRVKKEYGELPYFDVWIRGEAGYQINFLRHQWNGDEFEIVEQEIGTEVPQQLWKNFD